MTKKVRLSGKAMLEVEERLEAPWWIQEIWISLLTTFSRNRWSLASIPKEAISNSNSKTVPPFPWFKCLSHSFKVWPQLKKASVTTVIQRGSHLAVSKTISILLSWFNILHQLSISKTKQPVLHKISNKLHCFTLKKLPFNILTSSIAISSNNNNTCYQLTQANSRPSNTTRWEQWPERISLYRRMLTMKI